MRFVTEREFNGITWYGYQYDTDPQTYWSMRFYTQTWFAPMHGRFLDL